MKLRPYQQECVAAVMKKFEASRSTLMVLATGTGKTVISAHIADAMLAKGRVLVLAHRDELIRQAADKFQRVTGHLPAIEKADEFVNEEDLHGKSQIIISSFQTQNSGTGDRKRMMRFNPKEFSMVWCDEAHHCLAPTFRAVVDYYMAGNPELKLLGCTATPDRADGEELGKIFETVAYDYEIPHAIRDGWLVPVHQRSVTIAGLDFAKIRTTAGDLNGADLEAVMMYEKNLHGIVFASLEISAGLEAGALADAVASENPDEQVGAIMGGRPIRRTLIFCVTVAHAERVAEILCRWKKDAAESVDGSMKMEDRRSVFERFKSGHTSFLCACMVPTEGFDAPHCEIIVLARPSKSRPLVCQMIGRGTRPTEELADLLGNIESAEDRRMAIANSIKPKCTVLDFVGNCGRHKLVSCADILGSSAHEDFIIDRAKEIIESGGDIDVEDAIEQAEEEAEVERQIAATREEAEFADMLNEQENRMIASRESIVAVAQYSVRDVNSIEPKREIKPGGASDKQIEFLVKLGVKRETAIGYGSRQAGAVITQLKNTRCTVGQASYLRRLGYREEQIEALNFEQAMAAIEAAKSEQGAVA